METVDFILQGKLNNYAIDLARHYSNLDFVKNIILSHWEDDETTFESEGKIKIVKNQEPFNPGLLNRNRQIISSLNGLKASESKFSVKLRNDQKISLKDMTMLYNFYFENCKINSSDFTNIKPNNKVGVMALYLHSPFHPRDHTFWGNTEDLINLFDIPLDSETVFGEHDDYRFKTRCETYITMWYFAKYDDDANFMVKNKSEYIFDGSPKINEAINKTNEILNKMFLLFPKVNIEWPKHYGGGYCPYFEKDELWYGK